MRRVGLFLSLSVAFVSGGSYLPTVPSTPFVPDGEGTYLLRNIASIVVDSRYTGFTNTEGQTLISPSLRELSEVFQDDLESSLGIKSVLSHGMVPVPDSIFVTLDPNGMYLDAAGRPTAEGYSITIDKHGVVISGASSLGAWWGTRTILQLAALKNSSLPYGSASDAPGWATRGAMNEFHLHLSDNLFVNKDLYTTDDIWNLYKRFRLWSDDPLVAGLDEFRNESYTRSQFDAIQQTCARRGVTIIPELEAPAHALAITKWKPELALEDDLTMVNITHPDTIPTLKTIWKTFLPWFHSKIVHIGADEYSANLTGDYQLMVDEMNSFIQDSHKQTRIWGTFTPNQGVNVPHNVSIQHWATYEDNPLFDYVENGYNVINSDFAFYIVSKWSGYFPQHLNKHLIFNGNPQGGAYAPHIFDTTNATNNAARDNPLILGHITPQWSDYGPLASTYLEAYYAWRNELPAMADKQWGGKLVESEYDAVIESLIAATPAQNLDRRVQSKSEIILNYQFADHGKSSNKIKDISGNKYHAISHGCQASNSTLHLCGDCYLETPLGSKGRNYSLSFSVNPSARSGTLFSGPDSALLAGSGRDGNVTLLTSGVALSLNYSLPINTWTDVTLSLSGPATYFSFSEASGSAGHAEFLTKFEPNGVPGSNGVMTLWAPITVEAPLAKIGVGFRGMMKNIILREI